MGGLVDEWQCPVSISGMMLDLGQGRGPSVGWQSLTELSEGWRGGGMATRPRGKSG